MLKFIAVLLSFNRHHAKMIFANIKYIITTIIIKNYHIIFSFLFYICIAIQIE